MNILIIILILNSLTIFVMARSRTANNSDDPDCSFQAPPGYIFVTQKSTQPTNTPKSKDPPKGALAAKICNIILGICFIFGLLLLLLI